MRKFLMLVLCAVVVFPLAGMGGEKKRLADEVTEWSSLTPEGPDAIPVGGMGQINGGFVTGERNGIQIGIRASERFQGLLPSTSDKKVGVYLAETGTSDGLGRATWNYDIHVDLRGAFGVAKGKTLSDYTLTLDTDIGDTIFGLPVPLELVEDFNLDGIRLYQTSLNPKFGNAPFDSNAPGTYHFTLTLTPKTFNGAPIAVAMAVVVE